MKLFLFLCMTSTLVFGEIANDTESPKNDGETSSLLPITDRAPRIQCPETTHPHPLTNIKGEVVFWRCMCNPTLLRLPPSTSCHATYREGPCGPGKYLAPYADGSFTEIGPEGRCIENPCTTDNLVLYKGDCYTLGEREPCASGYVLGVDEDTFEVVCRKIHQYVPNNVNVIDAPHRNKARIPCPLGMARASNGVCWIIWGDESENPSGSTTPP